MIDDSLSWVRRGDETHALSGQDTEVEDCLTLKPLLTSPTFGSLKPLIKVFVASDLFVT